MLIKLAFKPSTNKALDNEGNPGTKIVSFPMTLFGSITKGDTSSFLHDKSLEETLVSHHVPRAPTI